MVRNFKTGAALRHSISSKTVTWLQALSRGLRRRQDRAILIATSSAPVCRTLKRHSRPSLSSIPANA
jgi:hypothetical protein